MPPKPPLTGHALLHLRPRIRFRLDAHGRLLGRARPGLPRPPRLAICRSTLGNRWWFRDDLPHDLRAELARVCAVEPVAPPTAAAPRIRDALRGLLSGHAPLTREFRGPAFVFPALAAPRAPILLEPEGMNVPLREFPWIRRELPDMTPCAAIMVDGAVVSVCHCARNHPAAAEAGLDTAPAYRRRGYATAVTAAWAAAVQAQGRVALYSCDWTNTASRAVARRLGGRMYCEDWSVY